MFLLLLLFANRWLIFFCEFRKPEANSSSSNSGVKDENDDNDIKDEDNNNNNNNNSAGSSGLSAEAKAGNTLHYNWTFYLMDGLTDPTDSVTKWLSDNWQFLFHQISFIEESAGGSLLPRFEFLGHEIDTLGLWWYWT